MANLLDKDSETTVLNMLKELKMWRKSRKCVNKRNINKTKPKKEPRIPDLNTTITSMKNTIRGIKRQL